MQKDNNVFEGHMRDPRLKKDLLNRLKSIEGHIRGIQRMVEDDEYCIDVLNQTAAIRKALEKVDVMILESCATTAIRGDDPAERERVLRELLTLFSQRSDISYQPSAVSSQQPDVSRQPASSNQQQKAGC